MDPVTLFALANGAVKLVKEGCKLYKDIKGAAGDVKDVLKDLDDQFHSKYKDRAPTVAEKNQYISEKNRIIELNKRNGETTNIYTEIGNHLGTYFDNFYKCQAIFEEEERRGRNEVYTGDDSLGKRALQRVLMKKQLEQMSSELRELMVYQSPPELGALWTEVNEMMQVMGKEQKVAWANQMRRNAEQQKIRARIRKKQLYTAVCWGLITFFIVSVVLMFWLVIQYRIERHPELGNCIPPKGSWLYKKWTNLVWAECK
jgi:hypothetical protein